MAVSAEIPQQGKVGGPTRAETWELGDRESSWAQGLSLKMAHAGCQGHSQHRIPPLVARTLGFFSRFSSAVGWA